MKTYLSVAALFCLLSCSDNDIAKDTPDCVRDMIEGLKKEAAANPPAKVYRFLYEGRTVYYIPPKCCDIPSVLLDENCNTICNPDGGLSGTGSGTCIDFHKNATNQELIW
jgi:hypothetical protein